MRLRRTQWLHCARLAALFSPEPGGNKEALIHTALLSGAVLPSSGAEIMRKGPLFFFFFLNHTEALSTGLSWLLVGGYGGGESRAAQRLVRQEIPAVGRWSSRHVRRFDPRGPFAQNEFSSC